MKKIPTLLPKNPDNLGLVIDGKIIFDVTHFAIKIDGTSCLVKDGVPYCRYDAKLFRKKHGKIIKAYTLEEILASLPLGAIPCQDPDEKSGHFPHWIPVIESNPEHKYIWEGFAKLTNPVDGTYECIGPKINGNLHKCDSHTWIHHGAKELIFDVKDWQNNPYEAFKNLFVDFEWEGLVAYNKTEPVAKIRRSDFGYSNDKFANPMTLFKE